MDEERRKSWRFLPALMGLALLGLVAIPIAMIGCAILEDAVFGTNYLEQFAQATGTHEAFGWLYEALQPIIGW